MDLLKYIIIGIGCILLGIVVALLAHSVWAGIGIMVLLFVGYILTTLVKDLSVEKTNTPAPEAKKDN